MNNDRMDFIQQYTIYLLCSYNSFAYAAHPITMASSITRTEQFVYLQSKANHYHKLKNIKPCIKTYRASSRLSSTIEVGSPQPESPRHRNHSIMKEYDDLRNNENLVNHILSIRYRDKCRVAVAGGYSRYNQSDTARISKYGTFRENQRSKSIDEENLMLGQKILRMKPSIGTVAEWNYCFENVKSRKKIASKIKQQNNISIYSKNQFVPEYYRTFLDRDGSTVAIKQKIFELPKVIARNHAEPSKTSRKIEKLDLDFHKIIKDTSGEIKKPI